MSDSVDPTWWAAAGAFGTALIGGVVRLVGSRKERSEAEASEDAATERAAELALRVADRADEDTRRVRVERDDCQAQLQQMREQAEADRKRLTRVEGEARRCDARATRQAGELAWMRRAVEALQRGDTTPPPRAMPTSDDVRDELDKET